MHMTVSMTLIGRLPTDRIPITHLFALEILIVIACLEEPTNKFHEKASVEVFVLRSFRTHQFGQQNEKAPGFYNTRLSIIS